MNTIITPEELIKFSSSDLIIKDNVELLQFYCQVATDYVEELLGHSLKFGEVTEYLKGTNSTKLYLKKRPIKELKSVIINDNSIPLSDFIVHKEYIEYTKGMFKQGFDIKFPYLAMKTIKSDEIKVTYTGGFNYPSEENKGNIPYDLKIALIMLINSLIHENSQLGNLTSYKIADISYTFEEKAQRDEKFLNIISRYGDI